jgi:hypothetical protein
MVKGGFGVENLMLKVKPILGYSDCKTVKLDLDNMASSTVKEINTRTMNWFNLGGYLTLKSSRKCYHSIFDRYVSWAENVAIMAWIALNLFTKNPKVTKWFLLQCIKGSSTLRITPKKDKPSPRIVDWSGEQNHAIQNFLKERKRIKRIYHSLKDEKLNGENKNQD